MKKKPTALDELKLKSFTTALNDEQMENVKGGFIRVNTRRHVYTVRWTSVDTRTDNTDAYVDKDNRQG